MSPTCKLNEWMFGSRGGSGTAYDAWGQARWNPAMCEDFFAIKIVRELPYLFPLRFDGFIVNVKCEVSPVLWTTHMRHIINACTRRWWTRWHCPRASNDLYRGQSEQFYIQTQWPLAYVCVHLFCFLSLALLRIWSYSIWIEKTQAYARHQYLGCIHISA